MMETEIPTYNGVFAAKKKKKKKKKKKNERTKGVAKRITMTRNM